MKSLDFIDISTRLPNKTDGESVIAVDDKGFYVEVSTEYVTIDSSGEYAYSFTRFTGRPIRIVKFAVKQLEEVVG